MILPRHLPVAFLQAALCLFTLVSAAKNYSIDDLDPLFVYSGNWSKITTNLNSNGGNLDIDGGHHLTYTAGSFATINYTFASVYFLATRWPYKVTTNYAIDGNTPLYVDMQDHSAPATSSGGNATVPSGVVGQWTSTVNQQHTILITIPPGDAYAVVDMFIFEVLDPPSSTSQTSSSTGTTSRTASSSTSSIVSPSSSSSESHDPSTTKVRTLAISMAIVGTFLAVLLIFLFWRFCIRRKDKDKNDGNMNPITPHYHPNITGDGQNSYATSGVLSTQMRASPMFTPGNNDNVPLNNNLASMRYGGATNHYSGAIQSNNLQQPPIALNYDPYALSHSDLPTLYTNQQSTSSLPQSLPLPLSPIAPLPNNQIRHDPQGSLSNPSLITDDPPMYSRNSILDESTVASSSSSSGNRNTKGKSRNFHLSSQIPAHTLVTAGAQPGSKLDSMAIPGRHEEYDSAWDSGYPQPLKFVPIT